MRIPVVLLCIFVTTQAFAQIAPKTPKPVEPTLSAEQLQQKDRDDLALRDTHVWMLGALLTKQQDSKLKLQNLLLQQKADSDTQNLNYALTTCLDRTASYDRMTIIDPLAVKLSGLPEFLSFESCLQSD